MRVWINFCLIWLLTKAKKSQNKQLRQNTFKNLSDKCLRIYVVDDASKREVVRDQFFLQEKRRDLTVHSCIVSTSIQVK